MTEPTKLPPIPEYVQLLFGPYLRTYARLAVEQNAAELKAEVERLRADAERYQWLRARYRAMSMDMGGNHSWVPDGRVMRELRGPTLNAAIDAALKETK